MSVFFSLSLSVRPAVYTHLSVYKVICQNPVPVRRERFMGVIRLAV